MKSSIKIIKRKRGEDSNDLKTPQKEKSIEQTTREMVSTVKSWIAELQRQKRGQGNSFLPLPDIVPAPANQNT